MCTNRELPLGTLERPSTWQLDTWTKSVLLVGKGCIPPWAPFPRNPRISWKLGKDCPLDRDPWTVTVGEQHLLKCSSRAGDRSGNWILTSLSLRCCARYYVIEGSRWARKIQSLGCSRIHHSKPKGLRALMDWKTIFFSPQSNISSFRSISY